MAPLTSLAETEEFQNKHVSLKFWFFSLIVACTLTYYVTKEHYKFQLMKQDIHYLKEGESKDITDVNDRLDYLYEKFKKLEDGDKRTTD